MEDRPHPLVFRGENEMMPVRRMLRSIVVLLGAAILLISLSTTATAHQEHKKKQPVAEQVVRPGAKPNEPAARQMPDGHEMDGMMADVEMDRSEMPFFIRLVDWVGRLHPGIVHFPIAFFPAALFTAIIGRKRTAFAAPVQFLVVAGGIFAPIAAATGWIAGLGVEPDFSRPRVSSALPSLTEWNI